ncbi:hypothetical protein CPB84DRAFT_1783877 [Gymnopilus junonius]|uniref:F-box domain-containing protein n=1 Tax=Gymnopilus junonius TaxID=109634 RepID=A0A9P5NLY9_GYMJU|nr:hypothetical protein CPB84DRAFT_1783877 [Gymnopilus junonius]
MDTWPPSLLSNNNQPSEDEIQKYESLMAAPLRESREVDQKIADLEAELTLLKNKRGNVRSSLQEYFTVMSSIRRLPDDILSETFYHCLPSNRNPVLRSSDAPILLMQHTENVKERQERAAKVLKQRVDIIKEWLGRSRTCPLSISLTYTSYQHDRFERNGVNDATTELLKTIISHSHHIRSLEMVIPMEIYRILDTMMSSNSFPILADLKADFRTIVAFPEDQLEKPEVVQLFSMPRLQRLSLEGYQVIPLESRNTLPFTGQGKNLTYFSSRIMMTHREAFHLLNQCDNIVHCRLHVMSLANPLVMPIQGTAFLPNLLTFAILDDIRNDDSEQEKFYSSIDAPHIQWVDYADTALRGINDHESDSDSDLSPPILHLLSEATELRKLTLDPWVLSGDEIQRILQVVSGTLTHLVVGHETVLRSPNMVRNSIYSEFSSPSFDFELLVADGPSSFKESGVLLPNLRILESSSVPISDDILLRIITSRMDSASQGRCAALKLVHVVSNGPLQINIKKEVELHRERLMARTGSRLQDVKLDLEYNRNPELVIYRLSSTFGLHNDRVWVYDDLDEPIMFDYFQREFVQN